MTASGPASPYALGSTDREHDRLVRQAALLAPCTERFFREAGIGPGQRVLDLGSGAGDVAMLAARIVGPSGEIVGVERDTRSIARARVRVAEAGLHNVSFTESDAAEVSSDRLFDAAIGRFILQFVPDPVAVLRSVSRVVRPGGVFAFREVSWAPILSLFKHLPLWSACASVVHETLKRSGANTEIGLALHRMFQEAGLPAPTMRLEMQLGNGPDFTRWIYDLLCSVRPQIEPVNPALDALGDFETLPERLQAEVAAAKTVVPFIALVGGWSRKPTDKVSL
jgi:ubiquinone/menaquinone biosynthesis C-methylase UbiE